MPKPMRKKPAGGEKKLKKKTSILTTEKVVWVDYKDANLLRRFMSDRAKIRARRVTGNDQQQQAAVAKAIKLSREMALLPYSVRQVQQRTKGRGRDRRDADLQLDTEPVRRDVDEATEEVTGVATDGASVEVEATDTGASDGAATPPGDTNGDTGTNEADAAAVPAEVGDGGDER
jgi:small subunit ribosomal protein S18